MNRRTFLQALGGVLAAVGLGRWGKAETIPPPKFTRNIPIAQYELANISCFAEYDAGRPDNPPGWVRVKYKFVFWPLGRMGRWDEGMEWGEFEAFMKPDPAKPKFGMFAPGVQVIVQKTDWGWKLAEGYQCWRMGEIELVRSCKYGDGMNAPNPLLTDPTNLTLQRRAWAKAQKEKNDQLRDAFLIFLLTLPTPDTLEAANLQFQRACEEYARQQALLSAAFIQQAYRVGPPAADREARPTIKPPIGKIPTPQQQSPIPLFLLLLLGMTPNAERLRLLMARARQSLAALGPYASARAAEIITRALLEGWTPAQLKAALVEEIGITAKRASLIAETEFTRAHAEGQLDALEALGIKKVGAVIESVEFTTVAGRGASDAEMKAQRVCPKCRALARKVFTIKRARGVIPVHIRCRCRWTIIRQAAAKRQPAIVGV